MTDPSFQANTSAPSLACGFKKLPNEIELAIHQVRVANPLSRVKDIDVQMVWELRWTQERMSDAARLQLGLL